MMFRKLLILLMFCVLDTFAVEFSEVQDSLVENTIPQEIALSKPDKVYPLIVAGEVFGFNGFIWAWDRYVLDKGYARTGPSYWKRNFKEGWEWDHNHWAINFYGHPYQGATYYNFARGAGYGFYGSLLFAALGSYTWEMFAETEYPSINDLIATSIGGSVYGEVLYRLSRKLYGVEESSWYKQVVAFGMAHSAYLQRKVFGNRDGITGDTPLEMSIFLGAGSHFGNIYRFVRTSNNHRNHSIASRSAGTKTVFFQFRNKESCVMLQSVNPFTAFLHQFQSCRCGYRHGGRKSYTVNKTRSPEF